MQICSARKRVLPDICQMDSWVICATSKNLRGQHREQKGVVCTSKDGGEESENGVKELSKGAEEGRRCEEPVSMCHSTSHQTMQNAKHGVCACAMNL